MTDAVKLKDNSEVVIRPLTLSDLDRSLAFFKKLPAEDRKYLRSDVTNPEVVERRIRSGEPGRVWRLVALSGDEIVADGSLEVEVYAWKGHVGELRLIVARPFQRKGLGMLMARELYLLAAREGIEQVIVKMMKPQTAARSIFKRLGFHEEVTFSKYVKDLDGANQDLVLMRCDLNALWREIEDYFEATDWQRAR